jgi:glycosyltransferase A (GT-A) superfamily protein (DUF2064 family)
VPRSTDDLIDVLTDHASTVIVLAKEPRPGKAKTRLHAEFSPDEAAALAGCAIEDTIRAVRSSRATRKILAWDGDPGDWEAEFEIVQQPAGTLNDRLAAAFVAVQADPGAGPSLLIGMDTPQVTAAQLDADWDGADAVLGLSEDGGFWAIGLRIADPHQVFAGIPMSTDRTGAAQLARLAELGLQVRLLPPLRDVDLPADAEAVARRYPWLEFSRRHRALVDARPQLSADRMFDQIFNGAETVVSAGAASLDLDVRRWSGDADPVDLMVVSRCEPPVVDLGCGPGRMLVALNRSGRPALGIDMSEVAVATSRSRGGLALHRRLAERLPAEGRWGTVLLVDSNVGMGGDIEGLLSRCCDLIGPGGLVICEVDPSPDRHDVQQVVLTVGGTASAPLPWSRVGARTLARFAARLDLLVVEEWTAGERVFVSLRRSG